MTAPLRARRRDAIRRRLLDWYEVAKRDLPWRHTRDPYRIWLSEAMLQQTRVETVIPYYERFTDRFPSVDALAAADEEDVLREWAGLGYYARARNLKRAAECIVRDHDSQLPRDPEALLALPGVGRYTVGAIRSIAFREPAPIVDGNVARILARLQAEPRLPEAELWALAETLVPDERPDLFNQAMMELGATLCTPRSPDCPRCPVATLCRARETGRPESFPAAKPKAPPKQVRALAGILEKQGRLLFLRRPSRGLLGGLWETPTVEGDAPETLLTRLRERTGLAASAGAPLGEVRHLFTHRALTLTVLRLERPRGRLAPDSDARWCTRAEARDLPLSALMKKTLRLAELDG